MYVITKDTFPSAKASNTAWEQQMLSTAARRPGLLAVKAAYASSIAQRCSSTLSGKATKRGTGQFLIDNKVTLCHQLRATSLYVNVRSSWLVVQVVVRSEERRVGKESVGTCRSGWSPDH